MSQASEVSGLMKIDSAKQVNPKGSLHASADVDAYLAALPADKQAALQKLRKQIHAAAPGAVETMSYGVPTFKLHGKMLVSIGAAKKHCALYGGIGEVVAAYAAALKDYSLSKGTIRFTPEKPIPAALVENLIKARVAQIIEAGLDRAGKHTRKHKG